MSFQRNKINPYRSLLTGGEGTSQDEPMAVRTAGQGESEGCSVMEQILVASAFADNIIGRESEQTSLRCFPRENWANRLMRQSRLRPEKLLEGLSGKEEPIRPCVPSHVA